LTKDGFTVDEALEVFLLRTQSLALTRTLHKKLLDSVKKIAEAKHKETRSTHRGRVQAFLAACRSYPDRSAEVSLFALAFPKEAMRPHFAEAVRDLRRHMLAVAHRLRLPWVTNRGVVEQYPVPTDTELMQTLMAVKPNKATAQKTIGHPLLVKTIQRHGWSPPLVEAALVRFSYDSAEAKRYVRMLAKNGAFESVI
jgi:hypothetical protein